MKIAIVSAMRGDTWPWGGSEELWAALVRAALVRGNEVGVWAYRPVARSGQARALAAAGATIHAQSIPHPRAARWSARAPLPRWWSLWRFRPDVILLSQGSTFDAGGYFEYEPFIRRVAAGGPPLVVVSHGWHELLYPPDEVVDKTRRLFRAAARVGFVSRRNLEVAERQLACRLPRAFVVRNPLGCDVTESVPWPATDEARFACATRLDAGVKGLDVLLETLGREVWRGRAWRLDVFGEGPQRSYLERLAAFYGLANRVFFRGFAADVAAIWRDAQVLLLPSRSDAAPIALVEAMACGRPAVGVDVGGVSEWVVEGETGFLAEGPTPRSFGAALERAWAVRAAWPTLGAAARERALAALSGPSPGAALRELLEEVVAGGPR